MAGGNSGGGNSNHNSSSQDGGGSSHHRRSHNNSHHRDMTALEAAAVHKAKLTADANFRPSHAVMNDTTLLLSAVDGPNLTNFQCDESVYVGRNVPIAAGATLMLPITIAVPGSVIEYIVECVSHDIIFGIIAERDNEGSITTVKEPYKFAAADSPVTQKFLVGTTPCLLRFTFDNTFSWVREKHVTYKITVTPPSRESLLDGRRRRATSCLKAIQEDYLAAESRHTATVADAKKLTTQVKQLERQLHDAQLALAVTIREEESLQQRKTLRLQQQTLLQQRLDGGWEDEKLTATAVVTTTKNSGGGTSKK